MESRLAVIIPAYKSYFLEQTLNSFVNQTNKNFTVYIGDDNSPDPIESIVLKFYDKLNIKYYKFETNLGGKSLTKHWERCIELSQEKWIWLFSDDDLVDIDCVERFFGCINDISQFYKFQTKVIDKENNLINRKFQNINSYVKTISSKAFVEKRLKCNGFQSFAVEYIFSRDLYLKNKFIDFPLAWASDDATWLNYSIKNGYIECIPAFVSWRASNLNISTSRKNKEINDKKILASIEYCIWLRRVAEENKIVISDYSILYWLVFQIASLKYSLQIRKYIYFIKQIGLNVTFYEKIKLFIVAKFYHLVNFFRF